MIKEFVTVEELTEKRTPQQLVEWFNYKLEEVIQKDGGKKALRMRKGLCKQFIEEIYPLSIFAGFEFGDRSDILLQPVIGNQNYDVLIFADQLSSSISKLEITLAIANDNYLKREMLQKEGYAPLSGNIQKKGTKNTEIKFESSLCTKSPEDFNEHINLIKKALNRKIEKNYESNRGTAGIRILLAKHYLT